MSPPPLIVLAFHLILCLELHHLPTSLKVAIKEGGKGPSIYDIFTHKYPDKFMNRSNGDAALDFYHRYKDDVKFMKFMGMDGFRFSIAWTRVLPRGKLSGGVNKEGIAFYNNLINELISNGLQPLVTIYHWDLPQVLEDEYGGFLSPLILNDYKDFAELCFNEFGDRVKHWITMNEPFTFTYKGYVTGDLAPGRCSAWMNNNCTGGDSATEPYIVAHHLLLCHGTASKIYKQKYQASQKGQIGITLISHWFVPYSNSKANQKVAQRAIDFVYGWFMHPVTYGKYPQTMRSIFGKRLPEFTPEQAKLVKGSCDYIGLNYYTGNYAADVPYANTVNVSYLTDMLATLTTERNGISIGNLSTKNERQYKVIIQKPKWMHQDSVHTYEQSSSLCPQRCMWVLQTSSGSEHRENGMGDANNVTTKEGVKDYTRIYFYRRHLGAIQNAIKAGVKVKGLFAWALLDNWEWDSGYTQRFGLGYVDFHDNLKRYPKLSALWFKKFNLK